MGGTAAGSVPPINTGPRHAMPLPSAQGRIARARGVAACGRGSPTSAGQPRVRAHLEAAAAACAADAPSACLGRFESPRAGHDPLDSAPSSRRMEQMRSSLAREIQALETTEKVVAALTLSDERDDVIQRLIRAIEDDRAIVLASMISGQAVR